MSASVGADVCVGRCRTCLIILLASTNSNKNRKEQNFDIEVLLFSLVEGHLQGGKTRKWYAPKGQHYIAQGNALGYVIVGLSARTN